MTHVNLQADCQEPGSAPEPNARQSIMGYLYAFYVGITTDDTCEDRQLVYYTDRLPIQSRVPLLLQTSIQQRLVDCDKKNQARIRELRQLKAIMCTVYFCRHFNHCCAAADLWGRRSVGRRCNNVSEWHRAFGCCFCLVVCAGTPRPPVGLHENFMRLIRCQEKKRGGGGR